LWFLQFAIHSRKIGTKFPKILERPDFLTRASQGYREAGHSVQPDARLPIAVFSLLSVSPLSALTAKRSKAQLKLSGHVDVKRINVFGRECYRETKSRHAIKHNGSLSKLFETSSSYSELFAVRSDKAIL